MLASARYAAVNSGRAQDVAINPGTNQISFREQVTQLPEKLNVVVHSAREINRRDEGVIRFYPEGGSSGGDIELERPDADGLRVSVEWLDGRVTHARYDFD